MNHSMQSRSIQYSLLYYRLHRKYKSEYIETIMHDKDHKTKIGNIYMFAHDPIS